MLRLQIDEKNRTNLFFQPLSTIKIIALIAIILSLLCTLMMELLSGTFVFWFYA